MAYKVSDECFFNELWIYCYTNQINGYHFGAPQRIDFKPIVPLKPSSDPANGAYNREGTLAMSGYSGFTSDQRAKLLAKV